MAGFVFRVPLLVMIACLAVSLAARPAPAQDGGRLALLISNEVEPDGSGRSPSFKSIADRLGLLGFSVTSIENAGRERMEEAIRAFAGRIKPGSTALFLFRGAMLRLGQKNFLMPYDAKGSSEDDAREAGIELNAIESDLSQKGAGIKIFIVDAARSDAVAQRFGVTASGPAALELHDGTLAILNAGQNRRPGSDYGAGEDDLFLSELLKQTGAPGVTLEQAFARTRIAVAKATGGRQVPSVSSSLLSDFSFASGDAPARPPVAPPQPADKPAAPPATAETVPSAPSSSASGPSSPDRPATPPAEPPGKPQPGEIFRDCDTCPELVVVPAGEFTMGGSETEFEKPAHRVAIAKPFAIGRYEVTFAEWEACVAAKACKGDVDDHGFGRGRQPVIDVSWDEAQAFVKWLSATTRQAYRLPSEAEWEYAARAGSRSAFPWGAAAGTGRANCLDCGPDAGRATSAVGAFRPNAFGLFDTSGNAAEWVEDCWNAGYKGAPATGAAWTSGQCQLRVLRGGAFGTKAAAARSAARFRYDRDVRYYTNGFRVARDLQ